MQSPRMGQCRDALLRRQTPDEEKTRPRHRGNEESWRSGYGPFVTDLATGRLAGYPEVVEEAQLRDGDVFRLTCPPGS